MHKERNAPALYTSIHHLKWQVLSLSLSLSLSSLSPPPPPMSVVILSVFGCLHSCLEVCLPVCLSVCLHVFQSSSLPLLLSLHSCLPLLCLLSTLSLSFPRLTSLSLSLSLAPPPPSLSPFVFVCKSNFDLNPVKFIIHTYSTVSFTACPTGIVTRN